MNTKILGVLGVMALMVGAWFFYKEDVQIEPATPSTPNMSYEVNNITASQTNPDTGAIEYTLTADSLRQNSAGVDEMTNITMDWMPQSDAVYRLTSALATLEQQTGTLKLTEGFVLTKTSDAKQGGMTIKGDFLIGNTKDHTIQSNAPITVTQESDSFVAQGFVADLSAGEYEFYQIDVQFGAPKRTDKPLF